MTQTQTKVIQPRAFVVLEESDWTAKFKPIVNHLDENASGQGWNPDYPEHGCMFETYGPELQYVLDVANGKIPGMSNLNVWTFMDGDGVDEDSEEGARLKAAGWIYDDGDWIRDDVHLDTTFIGDGYHLCNRIGYFITSIPADENTDYNIRGEDRMEVHVEAA